MGRKGSAVHREVQQGTVKVRREPTGLGGMPKPVPCLVVWERTKKRSPAPLATRKRHVTFRLLHFG